MVVVIGVAMALIGFVPRAALGAWGVLAGVVVIGLFGALIRIPRWIAALSPLDHTPMAPAASVELVPLLILTAVAVGLLAAGFVGLARRDLA
jgi:ABC-2 type transport system permease protein